MKIGEWLLIGYDAQLMHKKSRMLQEELENQDATISHLELDLGKSQYEVAELRAQLAKMTEERDYYFNRCLKIETARDQANGTLPAEEKPKRARKRKTTTTKEEEGETDPQTGESAA